MALGDCSADRQERLEGYLRAEDFFEDLPVIEDSQRVVRELVKDSMRFTSLLQRWSFLTPLGPNTAGCGGIFPGCILPGSSSVG